MRWTERQRAMLAAMGVRLWERAPARVDEDALATSAAATTATAAEVGSMSPPPDAAPRLSSADRSEPASSAPASPGPKDTLLPAADWLFVGEPLDGGHDGGAEAQLLDNLLRAIGVGRSGAARSQRAAYLSLAERPAGSAPQGDPDRRERLRRTVEVVRPVCIVALGRSAAQAVLATDEPLGSLRGRAHEHAGVAVFVTCPLAFLLRHPEEKAKAWADLCLAVAAADAAIDIARPD